MDTISETAAQRLRGLNFWTQHGLAAAMDAFGVSRRTLYGCKRAYRQAKGNTAALNNHSRAPVNRRKRHDWGGALIKHLVWLRGQHPALGFESCTSSWPTGASRAAWLAPASALCAAWPKATNGSCPSNTGPRPAPA